LTLQAQELTDSPVLMLLVQCDPFALDTTMSAASASALVEIVPRACLAPVTELVFVHEATGILAGERAR
jgi:hypothetical protein